MSTGSEPTAADPQVATPVETPSEDPVGAQVEVEDAARQGRAARRLRLVQEWSEDEVQRPARRASRLTAEDWHDLRASVREPVSAAMVVAARTSDPDIAGLPEFPQVEQRALDTLLAADPGTLTRAHRTMVVTAAMRFTMIDGEEVEPVADPLDDLRGQVSKHIMAWVVANATL